MARRRLKQRFVEQNWPQCVEFARESLAAMLKRPDVPETAKAQMRRSWQKTQLLGEGWPEER
ncbi:MAG: hypothetical protein J2P48_06185 [Alphaproteobacteria bacterium]|nr:hypothetical protein [Alphaproteobacteria bacterium]